MLDLWRILNAIDYIQKRPWVIEGGSKSCCSGGAGLQVLLIKNKCLRNLDMKFIISLTIMSKIEWETFLWEKPKLKMRN